MAIGGFVSRTLARRSWEKVSKARLAGEGSRAFSLLMNLAESGDADACYEVGKAYVEATLVPASPDDAHEWLIRAARTGQVDSQILLARLCITGILPSLQGGGFAGGLTIARRADDAAPDWDGALGWSRLAAQAGSAEGQAMLAHVLSNGPDRLRDPPTAREMFRKSAGSGCPSGMLGLAMAIAADDPDEQGRTEIAELLSKAAAGGLAGAAYMLAEIHDRGLGVHRDPAAAIEFYRTAAEAGIRDAQARYGLALLEGRGTPCDRSAGETWLRRAALAGDPEAAAVVGDIYAHSLVGERPLPPNHVEAASWYRLAADGGHVASTRIMGAFYASGTGVGRDTSEAMKWFRLAAAAGDRYAAAAAADLALEGAGNAGDASAARAWFEQAVGAGDQNAKLGLALCHLRGVGGCIDGASAVECLRACPDDNPAAQLELGRALLGHLPGVKANPSEARRRFSAAAAAGSSDGCYALGTMLLNGRGGPTDHDAALDAFIAAAGQGHAAAMFSAGAMLGGGHDVPADRVAARHWFETGANLGNPDCQWLYGRYLARGLGGPVDSDEALLWLRRAVVSGLADASEELTALEKAA